MIVHPERNYFVCLTDHFIDCSESEPGHILPYLLGNKEHEIHKVFRFAAELFAQFGILGSHADGTSIKMAFTHHDTTLCHEWSRGETEFFGSE